MEKEAETIVTRFMPSYLNVNRQGTQKFN